MPIPSDLFIRLEASAPMDIGMPEDEPGASPIPRTFSAIAYSGGVITDHWMGPCLFDLSSTEADPPIPLLHEHCPEHVIGQVDESAIASDIRVSGKLYSNMDEHAMGIAGKADSGHAWQMSVGIYPGSVEEYAAGAIAAVNGLSIPGPLTVFRGNRIREVSVCAVGADPRTSLQVFSAGKPVSAGEARLIFSGAHMATLTSPAEFTAEISRLSAEIERLKTAEPDPTKFVPYATFAATQAELQQFRAEAASRAVEDLVSPALADGRILPAQESYARQLAASSPEQFAEFLKLSVPAIPSKSQSGNYGAEGRKSISRGVFTAMPADMQRDFVKNGGIVTD